MVHEEQEDCSIVCVTFLIGSHGRRGDRKSRDMYGMMGVFIARSFNLDTFILYYTCLKL